MTTTLFHPRLTASPQIGPEDLPGLRERGITDILCNRPDEEHPDGPTSDVMSAEARRLGMRFSYLPVSPGKPITEAVHGLAEALRRPGSQVFAYCRSGARSTYIWETAREHCPQS